MSIPNDSLNKDDSQITPDQGELWPEERSWHHRLSETLRTRLNAIIGFSELLALEPLSPNAQGDVKQILKAARDLLEVTNRELSHPLGQSCDAATGSTRQRTCDLLYIEDDFANFTLVERILELRPNLKLKHATLGHLGIQVAKTESPRLILLDLNLPDLHGAEVLQVLQKTPETAKIPVVVLSANAIPTQIEKLLASGARNYLTKPFDIDQFLAVVDEWAGSAATTA